MSPAAASLGTEIKGSVLEFFKEAILGVTTGNLPVRMLLLSTGRGTKQKQNKTHRTSLLPGRRKALVQKEGAGNHASQRTERSAVPLRKLTVQMHACRSVGGGEKPPFQNFLRSELSKCTRGGGPHLRSSSSGPAPGEGASKKGNELHLPLKCTSHRAAGAASCRRSIHRRPAKHSDRGHVPARAPPRW